MKPRRIFIWALAAVAALNVYSYTKQHTKADVLAYKRLASALADNDGGTIQKMVLDSSCGDQLARSDEERKKLLGNKSVLFTYYVIKQQRYSYDGESSYIVAEQVSRVKSPGVNTVIGDSEVRIRHDVQMVKRDNSWYVKQFGKPTMLQ